MSWYKINKIESENSDLNRKLRVFSEWRNELKARIDDAIRVHGQITDLTKCVENLETITNIINGVQEFINDKRLED
jgi:hypothetical protein